MSTNGLKNAAEEARIKYAVFDTMLGPALIAATEKGLCALRLCACHGAEKERDELRRDFPKAMLTEYAEAARPYAEQLNAFLSGEAQEFRPTLDMVKGTSFQRTVWRALQETKPGETVTYTELAARIGQGAGSARAVGTACAANGIGIAVPCHRARRADGSLAGFRWGLDWKRRLLELEAARSSPDTPSTLPSTQLRLL